MSIGGDLDKTLKKILADIKYQSEDRISATNYLGEEVMDLGKRLVKLEAAVKKLSRNK